MEQIKLIEKLLEIRKYKEIKEILKEMNDVDVAEMLEGFSDEKMIRIFRLLPKDDAADIFAYMSSDREHALIDSLTNKELENIINDLYSDDVMELLEEDPLML